MSFYIFAAMECSRYLCVVFALVISSVNSYPNGYGIPAPSKSSYKPAVQVAPSHGSIDYSDDGDDDGGLDTYGGAPNIVEQPFPAPQQTVVSGGGGYGAPARPVIAIKPAPSFPVGPTIINSPGISDYPNQGPVQLPSSNFPGGAPGGGYGPVLRPGKGGRGKNKPTFIAVPASGPSSITFSSGSDYGQNPGFQGFPAQGVRPAGPAGYGPVLGGGSPGGQVITLGQPGGGHGGNFGGSYGAPAYQPQPQIQIQTQPQIQPFIAVKPAKKVVGY